MNASVEQHSVATVAGSGDADSSLTRQRGGDDGHRTSGDGDNIGRYLNIKSALKRNIKRRASCASL